LEALAILEIGGWSPAMVVLDAMERRRHVRVVQTELNDAPGVCIKPPGRIGDIQSAAHAGRSCRAGHGRSPSSHNVIPQPAEGSRAAWEAAPDFNPLIEQPSVQRPENTMNEQGQLLPWELIENPGIHRRLRSHRHRA